MANNYFFCPASGHLNKYNEKGSIGPISYQFLRALSQAQTGSSISALVFNSYKVSSFSNVRIFPLTNDRNITEFSSFKFYLKSFFRFVNSLEYRVANIVHHFMPFAKDITFNLFFIFKDPHKKYILGPLIGTHVNTALFGEEKPTPAKFALISIIRSLAIRAAPKLLTYLSRWTLKNADIILFSDNYALNCYQSQLRKNQLIKVLGIGVDRDIFTRAKLPNLRQPNCLHVLFVGRLTERKGGRYLINAIAEVKKTQPDIMISCKFVGYGMQETELKRIAKNLNLSHQISFSGELKRNTGTVKYYQACDVVCIPALSDTWVSAKEALCCGKPVIITNVASHPEIVQDGINGYLVPIMDSTAIAKKLVMLATSSRLLQRLSANAYRLAQKRYNWGNIINSYLSIVNNHAGS